MRKVLLVLMQLFIFSSSLMAVVVEKVALSHDKKMAAFIFNDDTLKIYNLNDGSIIAEHAILTDSYVDKLAFSPDDTKINIYTDDAFSAWNIKNGEKAAPTSIDVIKEEMRNKKFASSLKKIKQVASVDTFAYNAKKKTIWVVNNYKNILIWDKEREEQKGIMVFKDLDINEIRCLDVSNDGAYIALNIEHNNGDEEVVVLDGSSYKIIQHIQSQSGFVYGLDFIDNTHLLLHSSYPIEVWDLNQKKRTLNLTENGDDNSSLVSIFQKSTKPYKALESVFGLDVNRDGNIAITGTGERSRAMLLDKQGKIIQLYQNIYGRGFDVRFSPDNTKVAFVYKGEHLLLYETKSAKLLFNMDLGGIPYNSRIVKFSENGRYVAVGSDGNKVSIVDIVEQKIVKVIELNAGVFSLAWVNQSEILAGTQTGLFLLDWQEGKKKSILNNSSIALDIDREKKTIAVGTEEDEIFILNQEYKVVKKLSQLGVGRITFGADGKYLVSASNHKVVVWNKSTYKEQCHFSKEHPIWAMAYSSLHHLIYIGDDYGAVEILDENCKKKN